MSTTILVGDVRARLNDLPAGSVQCVVTSPPYFGLRDYGTAAWDGGDVACDHIAGRGGNLKNSVASTRGGANQVETAQRIPYRHTCGKCGATRQDQQIGLEPTLAGYLAAMVEVFRGVRRVLRDDGVVWLNIGDSYANDTKWGGSSGGKHVAALHGDTGIGRGKKITGLKSKDLMMVPARLAIALQDDGWFIRSDVIWAKPNPMPESVTDRPTSAHEHIFLLTKSARYYYDADAVREESVYSGPPKPGNQATVTSLGGKETMALGRGNEAGRNLRNVWEIATQGFPGAHFATFPLEIPRRCIKAGTSEKGCCAACGSPWRRVVERTVPVDPGRNPNAKLVNVPGILSHGQNERKLGAAYQKDLNANPPITTGWEPTCTCDAGVTPCTVLDIFGGSGTTALVADQLGRNAILIELNPTYAEMARERITGDAPMFATVEIDAA